MRFCVNCGEPLIDGEKHCPKCEAQIRKDIYKKAVIEQDIVLLDNNSPVVKRKKILACFSLAFSLICVLMLLLIAIRVIVRMISVDAFTIVTFFEVISKCIIDPIWIAVILTCFLGAVFGAIATRRVKKKRLLQGKYLKCANAGETTAIVCGVITYVWMVIASFCAMFFLFAVVWMRPTKKEEIEETAKVLQYLHNFYIAKLI